MALKFLRWWGTPYSFTWTMLLVLATTACGWEVVGIRMLAEFADWSTIIVLLATYLTGGAIVAAKLLKYYLDIFLYRVESVRAELESNGPTFRPIHLALALPIACCVLVVSLVSMCLMPRDIKYRSLALVGPVMWCAITITFLTLGLIGLPLALGYAFERRTEESG